jgi:diaminopimelate epimerase
MQLKFEKWHGNLNDFIVTWLPDDPLIEESVIRQAKALCDREGGGIGADGILLLTPKPDKGDLVPAKLRIINSDGSIANTCGNGIRCAALSTLKRFYDAPHKVDIPDGFDIPLDTSIANVRFLSRDELEISKPRWPLVTVAMGEPRINDQNDEFLEVKAFIEAYAKAQQLPDLTHDWAFVRLANDHLVFFLDQIDHDLLRKVGPDLQSSSLWDGINVHLATSKQLSNDDKRQSSQLLSEPIEELFDVLVWERGAGETKACGSGASAVAKAAMESGFIDRSKWVGIDMPGGRLYIKQRDDSDPISLAGPGCYVFSGTISV